MSVSFNSAKSTVSTSPTGNRAVSGRSPRGVNIREETGLEVEIDAPIGSIEYWFTERGSKDRFHKTVHFYLMAPRGGSTDRHDPEFDVVEWFPYDEALETVGYPNEAEVLRKALALISDSMTGSEEKS